LLLVGATSAIVYYFLKKDNKDKLPEQVVANTDSVVKVKDTTAMMPVTKVDTTTNIIITPKTDSNAFKIVIKEFTNKMAAVSFYNKYTNWGHNLVLYSRDSVIYKIAVPIYRPLSDTLHVKDSLRIFYNTKTYVESN